MDYQIVSKHRLLLLDIFIIFLTVHCTFAIVNRDLILTPKQGLQLSGKRIFYDENAYADATLSNNNSSSSGNSATRPWERTLKHVTYLTLFTNAANGIITGNFSKVKEYNDFLQSTYTRSPKPIDSRFGDIVTLAQGRLEALPQGGYHFVEGNCDYECARESNMVATWHIQKIRHRDVDRKFHYEMKFSVSPMTTATPSETVVRGGPNKRTIIDGGSHLKGNHNNIQTYIQKEDDYPHSFSKILSTNQDDDFADRRYDGSRNIRQFNQHNQQNTPSQSQSQNQGHGTPMPQSTFLSGIYRMPPPHMVSHGHPHPHPQHHHLHAQPLPEHLNIGEYYKGSYGPKASPKIELFPNLLTMMFGKPNYQQRLATTFRPPTTYQQMLFPRPEVYTAPTPPSSHVASHQDFRPAVNPAIVHRQELPKLPEYFHSHEQFTSKGPQHPVITHHYHHHFFMANSSDSGEAHAATNSGEEEQNVTFPNDEYKNNIQIVTPQPQFTQVYEEQPIHTNTNQHILQQQYHIERQKQQQLQQIQQQQLQQIQQHQQLRQLQLKQLQQLQQQQQKLQKLPPAPQKFVFPIAEIEQHRVLHVTPVPPLKKPQYQQYYYISTKPDHITTEQSPIVVYPAPVEEEKVDVPTPRSRPFFQSQPMEEDQIRYSEPDPLYANDNGNIEDDVTYSTPEEQRSPSQLEFPQHQYEHQPEQQTERNDDTTNEHSESIEAQLPAPQQTTTFKQFYEGDDNFNNNEAEDVPDVSTQQPHFEEEQYEQKTSHSSTIKISTERTTESDTIEPAISNKATLAATPKPKVLSSRAKRVRVKVTKLTSSTTAKPSTFSTKVTTEKELATTTPLTTTSKTTTSTTTSTTSKPQRHFISTSTTETPLKSVSRYRSSNKRFTISTTTTEKPVLKWKPRRKEAFGKALTIKNIVSAAKQNNEDNNKSIATIREVTKANEPSSTTEKQPESTMEISNIEENTSSTTMSSLLNSASLPPTTTSVAEIYEVLTQKSISYKVGENGQEIPIIFNEAENEV